MWMPMPMNVDAMACVCGWLNGRRGSAERQRGREPQDAEMKILCTPENWWYVYKVIKAKLMLQCIYVPDVEVDSQIDVPNFRRA